MANKKNQKIRKHLTLEPETVRIILEIAKKEKRNENTVVDILVQEAAKLRAAS